MSEGVIYGVHIEPAKKNGRMREGPVVTFVARLPDWVVLDSQTEHHFKIALHDAMASAITTITDSVPSQANRQAFLEAACRAQR